MEGLAQLIPSKGTERGIRSRPLSLALRRLPSLPKSPGHVLSGHVSVQTPPVNRTPGMLD